MDQVRLGKDAAAPGDGHGSFRPQGIAAELLDGQVEPAGLVVQEGAGTCGADGIHIKAHGDPVPEIDNLGILAADIDDRSYLGDQGPGRQGMGRYLVHHHVGAHHGRRQLASRTGGPGGGHRLAFRLRDLPDQGLHGLDRTPVVAQAAGIEHAAAPVDQDQLAG